MMEGAVEVATNFVSLLGSSMQSFVSLPLIQSCVERSVIISIPQLDAMLAPVAEGMAIEIGLLKYMVCLFGAYPLALIFGLLPNIKELKHGLSFLIGFVMVQWTFGPDWIHSFVTAVITYAVCLFAPRKIMGSLAFWLVLGYMVAAHIYKLYTNSLTGLPYYKFPLDFTGCQMVLTMKLTSFAYNVADGANFRANAKKAPTSAETNPTRRSARSKSPAKGRARSKSPAPKDTNSKVTEAVTRKQALQEKIEASRRVYALDQLPSPLEFFGYVYCFTTIMVGPTFEYSTYEKCISGENEKKPEGKAKKAVEVYTGVGFNTPLGGVMAALGRFVNSNMYIASVHRLLLSLLCLYGYQTMQANGYVTFHGYDPVWIAAHPSHIERYWFMFKCMFSERLKFYYIWKVAEGACILAGFGFSGYDANGNSKGYRAAENMDVMGHEFATTVQILSRGWNKGTQGWLERYTFNRYNQSLLITYFISGVWHGVYPGFLLMFMSVPILTACERQFKAKINPLVVPEFDGRDLTTYPTHTIGYIYWFACMIGMKVSMNYLTQTFSMGFWENAWTAWSSYNHIPHFTWLVVYVILAYGFKAPKKKTA